MAVIGSIRKHSALAVIIVGIAIAAFVLSDLFKQGRSSAPPVGIVDGEEVLITDYNRKVDENIEIQKANQQKETLSPVETFNIKTSTWNQFLAELIMGKEYEELGLVVSSDELFDQVQGPDPHSVIKQYFVDPNTNQYSSEAVLNFLQNLDGMDATTRGQWLNLERYIKEDRLRTKYNTLVAKGYYVPDAFAEMDYMSKRVNAEMLYVAPKFAGIADSLVTINDEDYEKYYEDHKYLYEQEDLRDIDYVVFNVLPSDEDRINIEQNFMQIYDEFLVVEDVPAFVNTTSDNRYDSTFFKEGQLPVQIDSLMFNSRVGAFSEAYQENNAWHAAKLMDVQLRPDSMKAEHVLIAYRGAFRADESIVRTKEDAEALADSLLSLVARDRTKIKELAIQFSDDGSAQQNSGDLGWFADGQMVHPFNEACLNGRPGDVLVTETIFGYHVIHITGKQTPVKKIRIAMIDRSIDASSTTFQETYTQASIFAGENNTVDKFEQAVVDQGLNKRSAASMAKMASTLPGLQNAREIVRWAYFDGINVGDVSPVFDVGGSYVVAIVTLAREKGYVPLDQLKDALKMFVANDKKAEYIKNIAANAADINALSAVLHAPVDTSKNLTFSSRNIPGFGSEYEVIGGVFGSEPSGNLQPFKGNGGVFFVLLNGFTNPGQASNLVLYKNQLKTAFTSRVNNNYIYTALEKQAEIEDNRLMYF